MVLLLGHIIADFYMQSAEMAEKKEKKIRWVLLHSLSYWVGMLLVMLPFLSWNMFMMASVAGVGHLVIDLGKYLYKKFRKKENQNRLDRNTFIMDQILHVICLFVISYFSITMKIELTELECIKQIFIVIQISEKNLLSIVLAVLLIYKPADILIQKIIRGCAYNSLCTDPKSFLSKLLGSLQKLCVACFL